MAKFHEDWQIATKLIHAGEMDPASSAPSACRSFRSAMYEYAGGQHYHDIKYIRLNNTPNHIVLHAKLAALENAEAALVTASGMAAITTALLAVLSAGDHLLAQESLYGGTHDFFTRDLASFGIAYDFIDIERPETWAAKAPAGDQGDLRRDDQQSADAGPRPRSRRRLRPGATGSSR